MEQERIDGMIIVLIIAFSAAAIYIWTLQIGQMIRVHKERKELAKKEQLEETKRLEKKFRDYRINYEEL